jgi:hypothetical protein
MSPERSSTSAPPSSSGWWMGKLPTTTALKHASRCLELTDEFAGLMQDFDLAYAYEGLARANAAAGNRDEVSKYLQRAEAAGQAIRDEEDRNFFFGDFNAGNWYGLR